MTETFKTRWLLGEQCLSHSGTEKPQKALVKRLKGYNVAAQQEEDFLQKRQIDAIS